MAGDNNHDLFYRIMGVSREATPEELRKAYKRKALQLHPDKRGNSATAQEEFMTMKRAYDVLSDPQKREIYDRMGEDGVKVMEDIGSFSVDEMTEMMTRMLMTSALQGRCLIWGLYSFVFGWLALIPIFWILRIDETIDWNWATVFVPLWILDGLLLLMVVCCSGKTPDEEEEHEDGDDKKEHKGIPHYGKIQMGLFLLFQIFLVLQLDMTIEWNWFVVFCPWMVMEVVRAVQNCIRARQIYKELLQIHVENDHEASAAQFHADKKLFYALYGASGSGSVASPSRRPGPAIRQSLSGCGLPRWFSPCRVHQALSSMSPCASPHLEVSPSFHRSALSPQQL